MSTSSHDQADVGRNGTTATGILCTAILWVACFGACAGAEPQPSDNRPAPECTSLLGRPLYADPINGMLLVALDTFIAGEPDNLENVLEKADTFEGSRRFHSAIALYSEWLAKDPDNVTVLKRRGHRYINVRDHAAAIADLSTAAQLHTFEKVESLGYKDNLHWAIYYYLGLALALDGDREAALSAFQSSYTYAADKTALLASTNWIHNLLHRLGRPDEAREILEPIKEGMGFSGNYYKNILVYKGLRKESEVFDEETALGFQLGTMGYGMANWRRVNGDVAGAERLLRKVANGSAWHSNGVMAAEADLARRQ